MKNSKLQIASVIIVFVLMISGSANLYSQWISQTLPGNPNMILSIGFSDMQIGLTGGWKFEDEQFHAQLFSTTNTGAEWTSFNLPDSVRSIAGIEFVTSERILLSGAYNLNSASNSNSFGGLQNENALIQRVHEFYGLSNIINYNALLLDSKDGGKHWTINMNIPPVCNYYFMTSFLNDVKGILVGSTQGVKPSEYILMPHLFKTIDSGSSWKELEIPFDTGSIQAAQYVNENLIVSAGFEFDKFSANSFKGVILFTKDEGNSFTKSVFEEVNNFTSIHFINAATGFVAGVKNDVFGYPVGALYKTTNGGNNWHSLGFNLDSVICRKIMFSNSGSSGIVFGSKYIKMKENLQFISRTTDYGLSWSSQIRNDVTFLSDGILLDDYDGFITGGTISGPAMVLHTTNGGSTLINNNSINSLNSFSLSQNFPNPFNPSTIINYYLPSKSYVTIKVYDVRGNEIKTLVDQKQNTGKYNVEFSGKSLPSGVYFYKLFTDNGFVQTKKMLLIK